MKRKVITLLFTGLAVLMLGGCSREPKEYDVTIELGEKYVFDATKIFGCSDKEASEKAYSPVLVAGGTIVLIGMIIGAGVFTYKNLKK